MVTETVPDRRPRGVTAVVALGVLQGLLAAVLAVVLVAGRGDGELRQSWEASEAALLGIGVAVSAFAAVQLVVAVALARGSELARSVYAWVDGLAVALAVYSLVALRDLRLGSVWALVLPLAVLWLLYGPTTTRAWFER